MSLNETAANQALSDDQKMLMERLALSTLTPGVYTPSENMKAGTHVAVFVEGKPLILTGPTDDHVSYEQAQALVKSEAFAMLANKSGYISFGRHIHLGEISGSEIEWQDKCSAIVTKESGKIEDGMEKGDLMAVILADDLPLATVMCIDSEIAKAIDPLSPLPNTREYPHEAQDEYEGMERFVRMEKEIESQRDAVIAGATPSKYSEDSVSNDFQSLKEYSKELGIHYPHYIVTQAVSMMSSSLYSNYMMANEDLSEIKYLHVTHKGVQEWETISVDVAKKRLENAHFPQLVKEWGLDKVQDDSLTGGELQKEWFNTNKPHQNNTTSKMKI